MILERVKNFIDKYELQEPFIVAFSGGYDSMCLLDVLHKLQYKLFAVHLNHNWRGVESEQEQKNCKNFCQANNIEFYSETLPDNIEHTETAARNARYEFFENCAKKFKSNVIFTAHNFDDNAETVLYRIIKGTGTAGLQGILENRDIYYRPLLNTTRKEIEEYCKTNHLTPNNDSSNENTKYRRNLIRKKIIPLMKEINPNVINAINSLSEIAKEDQVFSNSQKYEIRKLLIENNIDYDKKKINEIFDFVEKNKFSKSGKTLSLGTNLWLFVNKDGYKTISKTNKSKEELKIEKEGEFFFENAIFSIKKIEGNIQKFPNDSEYRAYINTPQINFSLRHRADGDFIQPLGSNGSQKLKKYLNEKKIPNHEKDQLFLLCNDKEVLWVAGLGLSEKIKVQDNPTHIIELRNKDE